MNLAIYFVIMSGQNQDCSNIAVAIWNGASMTMKMRALIEEFDKAWEAFNEVANADGYKNISEFAVNTTNGSVLEVDKPIDCGPYCCQCGKYSEECENAVYLHLRSFEFFQPSVPAEMQIDVINAPCDKQGRHHDM